MRTVKLKAHRISAVSCLHQSPFIFLIHALEGGVTAFLAELSSLTYSQGIKETLWELAVKLAADSLPSVRKLFSRKTLPLKGPGLGTGRASPPQKSTLAASLHEQAASLSPSSQAD